MARKNKTDDAGATAGDSGREDDLFIQEVNEELKQERYARTWKKYGQYFVGAALIAIVSVGGWQYWKSSMRSAQQAQSVDFTSAVALAADGRNKEASKLFDKLARETDGGYAALARLRQAAMVAKSGDAKGAAAIYKQLADSEKAAPEFRSLGTVLWALHMLDTAKPDAVIAELKPLTAAGQPWRYTALELTAHYHQRAGRNDDAAKIFKELSTARGAPETLRRRAAEMLSILGKS